MTISHIGCYLCSFKLSCIRPTGTHSSLAPRGSFLLGMFHARPPVFALHDYTVGAFIRYFFKVYMHSLSYVSHSALFSLPPPLLSPFCPTSVI